MASRLSGDLDLRTIALGFVYLLMFAALAVVGSLGSASWIWALYALSFVPYLLLIRMLKTHPAASLLLVLGLALVARIVFLPVEPALSSDIFRYVWEGRVSIAGFNPFVYAPDATELAYLRDAEIWPHINHKSIPTIYPPIAQFVFAFNALLGGGTSLLRVLFILIEVACFVVIFRTTTDSPRLTWAVAAYALNPLVIVETAWSGHLDVMGWMPAVAGLWVWHQSRSRKAIVATGVLLGLSIGAKFLGLFALAAIFFSGQGVRRDWPLWRKRLAVAGVAFAVVAVSYLPYLGAGPSLFTGFGKYAASWRSNDGLFRAETAFASHLGEQWAGPQDRMVPGDIQTPVLFRLSNWDAVFLERGWTKTWQGQTFPDTSFALDQVTETLAKVIGALLVSVALMYCVFVGSTGPRVFLLLMGTLLLVAPTVHPWYVAWLVPFAAWSRDRWVFVFSFACLAGYASWHSLSLGGEWTIPWWLAGLEYGLVGVAVVDGVRREH